MSGVSRVLLALAVVSGLSGTAAAQDADAKNIVGWGNVVDPAGDCQVQLDDGKLVITVPGSYHDLNPTEEFNNLLAPRVLQDVEGDFALQVKVQSFERPQANTSTKTHSYVGAGLLVWQNEKNFIRLLRAANGESGRRFIHLEVFRDGKVVPGPGYVSVFPDSDLYVRLVRKGQEFAFSASHDGERWANYPTQEIELPNQLKAGVMAINSTTKEFAPHFAELTLGAEADLAAAIPPQKEKTSDELQGVWVGKTLEVSEGRQRRPLVTNYEFDGNRVFTFPETATLVPFHQFTYRIDPEKNPKEIDFILSVGPFAGSFLKGIYKIENDVLTICYAQPGTPDRNLIEQIERPTEFDVKKPDLVLRTFERKKP